MCLIIEIQGSENTYYQIPNVLIIGIPDCMELDDGVYSEISDSIKKYIDIISNSIVFHQKGLNQLEQNSFTSYARILISYEKESNDFGPIIDPSEIPQSDMKILDNQFKKNVSDGLLLGTKKLKSINQGPLILEKWIGTNLEQYKGYSSLVYRFIRTMGSAKPVYVETHTIFTRKNIISITISCRLDDKDTLFKDIFEIMNTILLID